MEKSAAGDVNTQADTLFIQGKWYGCEVVVTEGARQLSQVGMHNGGMSGAKKRVRDQKVCVATAQQLCMEWHRAGMRVVCLQEELASEKLPPEICFSPLPWMCTFLGSELHSAGGAPVTFVFPALVKLPQWLYDSCWMLWLWEMVIPEQDVSVEPETHSMGHQVWRALWLGGCPHEGACAESRMWGWLCFWCLCCQAGRLLCLVCWSFSQICALSLVTTNFMGLEGVHLVRWVLGGCCRGKCNFLAFLWACLGSAA